MDDQPEVIRQQMEATRTDLTQKIEALENKVVNTVENTTSAVTDTVASVKEAVQDTVQSVKETVTGSVGAVKETLSDTAETVKDALDVRRYFEEYPWASFGASVAAGFVGGLLLGGGRAQGDRITGLHSRGQAFTGPTPTAGYGGNGVTERERAAAREASFTAAPAHARPSWLNDLSAKFGDEMEKLKGVALGALAGLARDWVVQSTPPEVGTRLREVFDDFTRKLGGDPMQGNLLSNFSNYLGGTASGKTSRERDTASESFGHRTTAGL